MGARASLVTSGIGRDVGAVTVGTAFLIVVFAMNDEDTFRVSHI